MTRLVMMAGAIAMLMGAQPAAAEIGRIKGMTGEVAVLRGGTRIVVAPGFILDEGDVIVTGRKGRAGISFLDDTRMALGPGSRITITEFTYDRSRQTGTFVARIDRGSVGVVSGAIAKSRRDAMRVRTPTSVIAVRGTRFVVDVK